MFHKMYTRLLVPFYTKPSSSRRPLPRAKWRNCKITIQNVRQGTFHLRPRPPLRLRHHLLHHLLHPHYAAPPPTEQEADERGSTKQAHWLPSPHHDEAMACFAWCDHCHSKCWPGPSAEMCRGFCCMYIFCRDFPGGFSWALFPTKMRRKIRRQNPRENPAAQKYKSTKNSVLPKTDLNKCHTGPRKFAKTMAWALNNGALSHIQKG